MKPRIAAAVAEDKERRLCATLRQAKRLGMKLLYSPGSAGSFAFCRIVDGKPTPIDPSEAPQPIRFR